MNFVEKLQSVYEKREALQKSMDDVYAFVDPILKELGVTWGKTSSVYIDDDVVRIERSGSCRGYADTDEHAFPLSIFVSESPIETARFFKKEKANADAVAERNEKLRMIKELTESL